ncbi:RagB/SusD family nutrient uptake outer membrane protein [Algoriphagus persicinus]|uniref:RagB/SusD family nutrient uptake outer membrane protein n=1 Tax=Algoriphagus persicinus TaxID=3108754 RepID=UPI002B3D9050|nr:RagB/SusD family nutrient uptake outer membrane protein [Algoriphagus sp. E1-3-M2]MEB2787314.1 RagB/SusD family nutrient uptake outer membrane protein [Algoriphagus sp. E1-3-M2]
MKIKNLIYIISFCSFIFLSTSSCNEDYLDREPLDQFAEDAVWNDPNLIETFVNNIYFGIPHGFHALMLSSLVDESMAVWDWETSNATNSLVNPSYLGVWDENFWTGRRFQQINWTNGYRQIRACNIFLEKIEEAQFMNEEWKVRLKGEVHFLRAFLYHNLVSVYGGVPLITEAYGLGGDYEKERASFEECIQFIVDESDKAAELLPLFQSGDHRGRATKGAAMALKARTLLYAASDLFHLQSNWAQGFARPELIGYSGGDRMAKWSAAKNAAKAVIDLGVYNLHENGGEPSENFGEIFLAKETSEDIFVKYLLQRVNEGWDIGDPGLFNGPNGYHNWGGNTPVGQLVDDFEMADGTRFDWSNPAHASSPYENRDPRFYATLLYEGAEWRTRPEDVRELDPKGIIQVGQWKKWNSQTNQEETINGLDTRQGPIEDWNGTYTGYYLKKFIDPNIDHQYFRQEVPWRVMRYTEVVLNYVEACIELGEDGEARNYLNLIRSRAGMPDINESGDALRQRYRNERRVELAYEDHRYFDVRRWMIAPQVYGNAKGVRVVYPLLPDNSTSLKPTYSVIEVQNRDWNDRAYLLPIKLDEMNRNKNLIQNPLY